MNLTPQQSHDIESQRGSSSETRRPTVGALEEILYEPIPVLDHGFVRVVDYMGNDSAIVQAARVSYGTGTKRARDDANLIRYLMRNQHTTPFEMCEIKYHVKLPIFVARQWIRHRTANVNEYSARYSILDREFYLPVPESIAAQSGTARQGRGEVLQGTEGQRVLEILRGDAERAYSHYEEMLNETPTGEVLDPDKKGLARELARMNLSLNYYTQWYWKIDLHNLLHFIRVRHDQHAQYEIRAYADVLLDTIRRWVPVTYDAFIDYQVGGFELSSKGLAAVRRLLAGERVDQRGSGMSRSEWEAMVGALGIEL